MKEILYLSFLCMSFLLCAAENAPVENALKRTRPNKNEPSLQSTIRNNSAVSGSASSIQYSAAEREFLRDVKERGKTFTVVMNPDRKPFSWVENGKYRGIFKDYADEISKRTGLVFRFVPVLTREEYVQRRVKPDIDIVFDTISNSSRAERAKLRQTKPYFDVSVSMLRDKNAGNTIRTISVITPGELERQENMKKILQGKGLKIRACRSMSELIGDVASDLSDAAYMYTRSAEYAVFADESNRLVATYVPELEHSFSIGVKDRVDPRIIPVLNRAVTSMDKSFAYRTMRRYVPSFKEVFSLNRFMHRHPFAVAFVSLILLLAGGLLLVYFLHRRRKTYQTGVLFGNFPLRCFVISEDGRFLYYTLGQRSRLSEAPKLGGVGDIPDESIRKLIEEKQQSVLKTGKTENAEFFFDGKYRSAVISKLPDSAFGKNTVLWISRDITELQASRDEAQRHEEFFRLTLDSIGDGVIIADAAGDILRLNPVAEALTGVSNAGAKGKRHEEIFRIVNTATRETVESPLRKALNTGTVVELGNHTDLLSHDGKSYHVADSAGPIRDSRGKIIGAVLVFRDVTEAYRQREALRASVANWTTAANIAKLYSYRVNLRTREEYGDLAQLNTFWPVVEGKAAHMDEWVYPEDLAAFKQTFEEFLAGGRKDFVVTYRAERGGALRHFRMFGRRDENNPEIMTGLVQDVTELFAAMEKLRENMLMWKQVMDELPVCFFVKDASDGCRYLMCNRTNAGFLGIPAEDAIGKTTEEIIKTTPEVAAYLQAELRVLESGQAARTRTDVPSADGTLREFEKIEMPFIEQSGRKLLIGIAFDITEQEQSRRLLAISARILSQIVVESEFSAVLDIVGQSVIDILSASRVVFAKTDDGGRLHFLRECSSDGGAHFNNGDLTALHENIWNSYLDRLSGREIVVFDRLGDEAPIREAFRDYPEYADLGLAAVPFFDGARFDGLMIVAFKAQRHFSDIERKTLRAIADCLQLAVVRARQKCELDKAGREQAKLLADRTAIQNAYGVFMNSDYMDVRFEPLLEIIREHLGASYCYVMRFNRQDGVKNCYAEATRGGTQKLFEGTAAVPFDPAAPWLSGLEAKGIAAWSDDPEAEACVLNHLDGYWAASAKAHGIHSLWVAALKPEGKMWGTLGIAFDRNSEKTLSPEDADFVASAGQLITMVIMRCMSRDRLKDAMEQAQSAEKAKSFFLASMSHEIRTPLNAVIGFTELMKDSVMDYETRQDCLENIYSSGTALLQLINDVLDLSKMEADQMRIIPEYTKFQHFCKDVCRTFQYSAGKKRLNLLLDVPADMPPLMLDQLRMRQILFNLVGNSIKFTQEGSVRIFARFTSSSAFEGALLLRVSDTGIGISAADQEKIFKPFVQLSKMRGTNASNSGTGLGLVIVRKLVDKMGGTLTLESKEGKGTTFSILLPQVMVADDDSDVTENVRETAEPAASPVNDGISDGEPATGLRVLAVDDVPMNLKILKTILKRMNVNVVTAPSGEAALEKLKDGRFDWVLTDLVMPGMNGVELAEKIREIPEYSGIRLAVLTAEQDSIPFRKGLFAFVLTKPINTKKIQETLFRSI